MARKDDPVFNIEFVKLVESQACLWNYTHPGYSKKEEVQKAWQHVANEIKDTVRNCRERWRTIRSSFLRSLKLARTQTGRGKRKYYLSKYLQFLIPYTKSRSCHKQQTGNGHTNASGVGTSASASASASNSGSTTNGMVLRKPSTSTAAAATFLAATALATQPMTRINHLRLVEHHSHHHHHHQQQQQQQHQHHHHQHHQQNDDDNNNNNNNDDTKDSDGGSDDAAAAEADTSLPLDVQVSLHEDHEGEDEDGTATTGAGGGSGGAETQAPTSLPLRLHTIKMEHQHHLHHNHQQLQHHQQQQQQQQQQHSGSGGGGGSGSGNSRHNGNDKIVATQSLVTLPVTMAAALRNHMDWTDLAEWFKSNTSNTSMVTLPHTHMHHHSSSSSNGGGGGGGVSGSRVDGVTPPLLPPPPPLPTPNIIAAAPGLSGTPPATGSVCSAVSGNIGIGQSPDADYSFLISLHPYLKEMNGKQNRRFRQKVVGLIDNVLDNVDV